MNGIDLRFPLHTWAEASADGKLDSPVRCSLFRLATWAAEGTRVGDTCIALFTSKTTAEVFARENSTIMAASPIGMVLPDAAHCQDLLAKLARKNANLKWVAIDKVFLNNKFDLGLHPLESMFEAVRQSTG